MILKTIMYSVSNLLCLSNEKAFLNQYLNEEKEKADYQRTLFLKLVYEKASVCICMKI